MNPKPAPSLTFGRVPAHVTYVALNFNTQMLEKRLPEYGYDEKRGFTHVQDADHAFLHDTYLNGPNAKRTVAYGYTIASAVVKR